MAAEGRMRRPDIEETPENVLADSLEALAGPRTQRGSGGVDIDEAEFNEALELPGADLSSLSAEDLTMPVMPQQADEFTCSECFLVRHRSRLARISRTKPICQDCAQPRRPRTPTADEAVPAKT